VAKTYQECPEDVTDLADEVLRRWHQDLIEAGVTITYLFMSDDGGATLTHQGYPAAAVIKKTSLKDRVAGHRDAILVIDRVWWDNHDNAMCRALLDHEMAHLLVARDDDGKSFITDDAHRPKLEIRKHDIQIGGFIDVAERHRMAAIEVVAVAEATKKFAQLGLFSGNDMEPNAA
jgi:hypothetical protein